MQMQYIYAADSYQAQINLDITISETICSVQISNQILQYTRYSTPKRVTRLRGPSSRHCAQAIQLISVENRGNTASNLTGLRFEP